MAHISHRSEKTKKLSEGTYGCTYMPPVELGRECYNCLSKVLSLNEYEKEMNIAMKLEEIDPEGDGWCRLVDTGDVDPTNFPDCIKSPPVEKVIQYEYGGETLAHIIKSPEKYDVRRILLGLYELYLMLANYNSNDIYHRDIKMNNVVMDSNYHFRFIDFGLAIEVKDDTEPTDFYYNYSSHLPPEFYAALIFFGYDIDVNVLDNYYTKLMTNMFEYLRLALDVCKRNIYRISTKREIMDLTNVHKSDNYSFALLVLLVYFKFNLNMTAMEPYFLGALNPMANKRDSANESIFKYVFGLQHTIGLQIKDEIIDAKDILQMDIVKLSENMRGNYVLEKRYI